MKTAENKKGYFKADPEKRFYPGQLVKIYPGLLWHLEGTNSALKISDQPDCPIGMLLSMKRTGYQYSNWKRKESYAFQVLIRVLLDDKIIVLKTYDYIISKIIFPIN